jgi:hypothetical protein
MLQLDHLFVCVEPEPAEAETLRKLGFTVEFRREHPGQGTRNQLLLFAEHYLELLWLADRAEAEGNMVRLDRRVDWRKTGASPFGIAMRGPKDSAPEVPWTLYELEGFPVNLWIDKRTLDDPRLPLVFVFDQPEAVAGGPQHGGYPRAFLEHACGATGIRLATVEGPGLGHAPDLPLPAQVQLREGPAPCLSMTLAGTQTVFGVAGELLRLS